MKKVAPAASSIGAAGVAASNLVLNGGTLAVTGGQSSTDRSLTLGASGLDMGAATTNLTIGADVALLEVRVRKAFLTEEGQVFLRRAKKLTQQMEELELLAFNIHQGWEAEVRLALGEAARQQLEQMPRPAHQDVKAARALNQQGLDALKRGDAAAAVTALQQAQRADPADVEVAGNLGYANLKLGQFKRAEQQLIYALSLAPDRVSSWFNLGQVYGALNQPEKATGAFANTYRFAQNRIKTEGFLRQALQNPENSAATRTALRQALALFGLSVDGP